MFATVGFAAASMSAIARKANVPKASVLYYFGSKEALYRGVLLNLIDLWRTATDVISADADPARSLSAWVSARSLKRATSCLSCLMRPMRPQI